MLHVYMFVEKHRNYIMLRNRNICIVQYCKINIKSISTESFTGICGLQFGTGQESLLYHDA